MNEKIVGKKRFLNIPVPRELDDAIEKTVGHSFSTKADFARTALREKLERQARAET